ncbi:MAG: hypothetical protein HYX34_15685 [Actinobacteria bacterium]|nr:hypothetical protein [Actinomycetota bacterium]
MHSAAEVMLDQERRRETQRFGLDVELHVVTDGIRRVDIRGAQQPEPQRYQDRIDRQATTAASIGRSVP